MLTQDRLHELFDYAPDTGAFTWKETRGKRVAGAVMGGRHRMGYLQGRVDGRYYLVHRLIWLFVHGRFPDGEVDHINLDKADNRLVNLRAATRSENVANGPRRSTNTSGFKGVSFSRREGRWQAQITRNRRRFHLGHYTSPELAHAAYVAAAAKFFGEYARVE